MKKGLAWPGDPGKGVRSAYMPNFARLETENLALHQGMRETLFEINMPKYFLRQSEKQPNQRFRHVVWFS